MSFALKANIELISSLNIVTIDLILIDIKSVGKRSLHLMDIVNAKKKWTTMLLSYLIQYIIHH
jgi:hypothetical protein